MVEITVSANSRTHQNVTQQAFSTGAIERNGLVADQPVIWNRGGNYFYQFKDPLDYHSVREFNDAELEKKLREEEELKSRQPPPTTADPHPPELVPDDGETFAIATSPDVCRSPEKPIPYMAWGKADDKTNYSPNVRSNGLVIKRQDSKFFRCYGDEPGVGKGVKSGTVEDVVEPVTSSAIVRANGIPVQRHADKCTLNNGNCPGEYVHVKSTEVHSPPDGNDEQNRGGFGRAWDGFYNNSDEAQLAGGALKKGEEYWNDPSRIGSDLQSAWDSRPSVDDVTSFGKNVGQGVANTADYVWNNPGQSAENVATWTGDALKGLWTGVTDAYDKGGVPQAGGHLAAVAVGVINPFKKAKTAGEAIEALEDVAKAERRAKEAEEAARKAREAKKAEEEAAKATENGDDGTRSTQAEKPYSDPKRRPKYADGQVEDVWEKAKDENGDVYDPNTGEKLTWDKFKSRAGQWDMGHKPGHEYRTLHRDYMENRITKDEFLQKYRDPNNYQPESVNGNRSHRYEQK
ncbi:PAAR-like domain-containing protein [Agrobacterium rosae]|uniref:PAAR-like domain-containing protein n=1 Tax=Agrobacterium rosae TaxID=1972867 RepID=UPI000CD89564|nr:PAAR-like domain-containing protein [Agrobacterium rosae]POO56710.1 hypothetical protein CTT39_08510 [Agrobacterium rosae]